MNNIVLILLFLQNYSLWP